MRIVLAVWVLVIAGASFAGETSLDSLERKLEKDAPLSDEQKTKAIAALDVVGKKIAEVNAKADVKAARKELKQASNAKNKAATAAAEAKLKAALAGFDAHAERKNALEPILDAKQMALAYPPKQPKVAKPKPTKGNVPELLKDANRAVAFIGKAVKDNKAYDQKAGRQKPFFIALKGMSMAVDELEQGAKAKDAGFLKAVDNVDEANSRLKIAWPRVGIEDPKIKEGLQTLENVVQELRRHYSKEALRHRKGGELTAKEKERFAKIKEDQKKFAAQVKPLQAMAKEKHEDAIVRELEGLLDKAAEVIAAEMTLDVYLTELHMLNVLQAEWQAYGYYVDPEFRDAWKAASNNVKANFEYWETIDVEIAMETTVEWAYFEEYYEVHQDIDVEIAVEEVAQYETMIETYEDESYEEFYAEYAEDVIDDDEEEGIAADDDDDDDEEDDDWYDDEDDDDDDDMDDDWDEEAGDEDDEDGDVGGDDE